jgi:predicted hydrocarbon binding protein
MEITEYAEKGGDDKTQSSNNSSKNGGDPFEGFAQAIAALKKLNQLESDIATIISSCRVPLREARKFLRCTTPEQVANISLFQYMKALFMQLGIDIEVSGIRPYTYYFLVKESAISDLYSETKGRTCHLVCEAIARFFNRDLNLSVSAEEISCVNAGDDVCEFETTVNKEDFCMMALNDEEKYVLKELATSKGNTKEGDLSGIPSEELEFKMSLFRELDLIDDDGNPTELGLRSSSKHVEEEEFDTPWKDMGEVSTAISSAVSFAEASHLSLMREANSSYHKSKTLDRKEVKGYKSFAELLAKQVDKESKSEGF